MLSKEQFDGIIESIKKDVHEIQHRFGIYKEHDCGKLLVKLDKQVYDDLIEFRKTLPLFYYEGTEIDGSGYEYLEGYDCICDYFKIYDGFFDLKIVGNEIYTLDITWVDNIMPIELADLKDYTYKVEFIYSVERK